MAAIGFRHQKVLILCFVGVMLGVGISSLFLPSKYKAETKLLVKRERIDPVIIAGTECASDLPRYGGRRRNQL